MKNNINKLYLYRFTSSITITQSIWVLYMSFKGLSLVQIGIAEAIFHISSFVFEIPSGAVADMYGRKKTLICSGLANIISSVLMLLSTNFIGFSIAMIFSALSYNLNSGSEEALAFDSLKEINKENDFIKLNANLNILAEIGGALGSLLGGFIASINYFYAYTASTVINIISSYTACTLTDIYIEKESRNFKILYELKKQIIDSIYVIKNNKKISAIMLFDAIIGVMYTTLYFYYQKHLQIQGFSLQMISIILTSAGIAGIIASKLSSVVQKHFNILHLVSFVSLSTSISIVISGTSFGIIPIIGFAITSFLNALSIPIFSNYINQAIPSDKRATIISVGSMIFSFIMIIFFPLVGKLIDVFGTEKAFIGMGFVLMILSFIFALRKKFKNIFIIVDN